MARGNKKPEAAVNGYGMPRFLDVKLGADERKAFVEWPERAGDPVAGLQWMADDGYRIGVSWSGEHQSYTVSMTCRVEGNPNNGLCVTSFAGDLETAIWLMLYKHRVVTKGVWNSAGRGGEGDFG